MVAVFLKRPMNISTIQGQFELVLKNSLIIYKENSKEINV